MAGRFGEITGMAPRSKRKCAAVWAEKQTAAWYNVGWRRLVDVGKKRVWRTRFALSKAKGDL